MPAADLALEPDGTIVIRVKPVVMTAIEMAAVLDARIRLRDGLAPILVDTRRVTSMSREAQEMTASERMRPFTDCVALLVDNPVSVVLANFFVVLVRPPYPTKMFRSEERARRWIADVRRTRP